MIEINRKILGVAVALMFAAMLVAPVMAAPANAVDKNPNAEESMGAFYLLDLKLSSGVTNRWVGNGHAKAIIKPADEFHSPTQLDVGDNFLMWLMNPDYRGKWVHMNKGVYAPYPDGTGYLGMHAVFGFAEPLDVPEEGVYIWGAKVKD